MNFGVHVCYKSLSGMETHLQSELSINTEQYGILNSAVSWVNLFLPFLGGIFADSFPTRRIALIGTAFGLIGQVVFATAVSVNHFPTAVLGRFVFGIGEGCSSIAQSVAVAQWFGAEGGTDLTFAMGITEGLHAISNWAGKVAVNAGIWIGCGLQGDCDEGAHERNPTAWKATNWLGAALCGVGFACAVVFSFLEVTAEGRSQLRSPRTPIVAALKKSGSLAFRKSFQKLTLTFFMILFVHFLVSNVEHLFDSISATFLTEKWGYNMQKAAWFSGLNYVFAILLTPFVGYLIDQIFGKASEDLNFFASGLVSVDALACNGNISRRGIEAKRRQRQLPAMLVAAAACLVQASANLLLAFTPLTPVFGLVLLSIPQAILPTLLRASVPLVLDKSAFGLAFGCYSVAENLGKSIGSPLIGYVKDETRSFEADIAGFSTLSLTASAVCVMAYRREEAPSKG